MRNRCLFTMTGLGLALGLCTFSARAGVSCADADISPPPNGDGVVNVNDLLLVVGNWGATGNNVADVNGDMVVDVNDLLGVIGNWGCTVPVGPSNDECTGATTVPPLVNGTNNINNTGATTSPQPGGSCTFAGPQNFTRDVWFTYTNGPSPNHVTFSLCATTGAVIDSVLAIYSGTCANLTEIGCDDDDCNPGFVARSTETVDVGANQTVIVRVGVHNDNPATGNMIMNISVVPVNNDLCSDATTVVVGGSVNDTLVGSTGDSLPACQPAGVPAGSAGRWHKVMGNGHTLTASLCGSPDNIGDPYDARVSVFCGQTADCSELFCVAASDDATCANPNLVFSAATSFCTHAGQEYRILVHADQAPSSVGYTLSVSDGPVCTGAVACEPPSAPNDECANAIPLVAGSNNVDTTNWHHSAVEPPTGTCPPPGDASSDNIGQDVWYTFTPSTGGAWNFSLCGSTAFTGDADWFLQVLSGPCASMVHVGCNDDFCGAGGYPQVSATLTAGTTYRLRLGHWDIDAPDNIAGHAGTIVINQGVATGPNCTVSGCAMTTEAQSDAVCGGLWSGTGSCGTPPCPNPATPTTPCPGAVAGNGGATANGIRPGAGSNGWNNGTVGMMEDMFLCSGATLDSFRVEFIDQTVAGTGTPSAFTQLAVRIYNLNNRSILALDPVTAVPVYTQTFTVGTNATKTLCGVLGTSDRECWVATPTAPIVLSAGEYGIWFSLPEAANVGVFISNQGAAATPGPANMSTPSGVAVWGMFGATPVNGGSTGTHAIFCVN